MLALALDIGGSHIGCGMVEDRRLLAHSSLGIDGASCLADALPQIAQELKRLLQSAGVTAESCRGIAAGFPGIVDARSGTILSAPKKFKDAPGVGLADWARDNFGLNLRVENDARMAVLGEHYAGAACDTRDVVMMTLGTGIGTGVILGGRLLRGVHAHAGCLGGHFTANFNGERCWCSNIGCAEVEAAGWSLPKLVRAWPGFEESSLAQERDLSFRELIAYMDRGDAVAEQVWRRCLQVWSANAVSLVHAYDPEVLVLGGGVLEGAAPIAPFVQDYIERHTWAVWGKAQVRVAALGNAAALLGAVPLLSEEFDGAGL